LFKSGLIGNLVDKRVFLKIVIISICLENENFAVGDTVGLEKIGGLRELEDLRGPFIIPARNQLTSVKCGGPLIKGSRDSGTADNLFTALKFWFVLFLRRSPWDKTK